MDRRKKSSRAASGIQAQVIAGRDGEPAFAVLPLEVFVTLLAYARKGGAEARDKVARGRLHDWLQEDDLASVARLFIGERDSGKASFLQKHFKSMLSDDRMEKTFEYVGDWLVSDGGAAARRADDDSDDAEDVAAYDAAKARDEESFPSGIADRLITGENPIKVFRAYRGLTQKQLAERVGVTAAYLSQVETGRRGGSVKLLHRLADILKVEIDDLV